VENWQRGPQVSVLASYTKAKREMVFGQVVTALCHETLEVAAEEHMRVEAMG